MAEDEDHVPGRPRRANYNVHRARDFGAPTPQAEISARAQERRDRLEQARVAVAARKSAQAIQKSIGVAALATIADHRAERDRGDDELMRDPGAELAKTRSSRRVAEREVSQEIEVPPSGDEKSEEGEEDPEYAPNEDVDMDEDNDAEQDASSEDEGVQSTRLVCCLLLLSSACFLTTHQQQPRLSAAEKKRQKRLDIRGEIKAHRVASNAAASGQSARGRSLPPSSKYALRSF
jgi:hypothetical protein